MSYPGAPPPPYSNSLPPAPGPYPGQQPYGGQPMGMPPQANLQYPQQQQVAVQYVQQAPPVQYVQQQAPNIQYVQQGPPVQYAQAQPVYVQQQGKLSFLSPSL